MEAERLGANLMDSNATEVAKLFADIHDLAINRIDKVIYYNNRSRLQKESNSEIEKK